MQLASVHEKKILSRASRDSLIFKIDASGVLSHWLKDRKLGKFNRKLVFHFQIRHLFMSHEKMLKIVRTAPISTTN